MKGILPPNGVGVNKGKDEGTKPPYSNTGAKNTRVYIEALIDWNSFTIPFNGLEGVEIAKQVLMIPSDDFVEMPKGANGYKAQVRCGDIAIFYDGKPSMGIHVCMTGQGCRQYEARLGNRWKELIKSVFELGGHFSRLDTALDDYTGRFTVKDVAEKVRKRDVKTYFRGKPQIIESHDLQSEPGKNDGESVYFGSGQSDVRIRFYNKAVEQGVNYPWVRTEIQCRDERADIMAKMIMAGGDDELGKIVSGVLRHYVNFLEPSETDSNKSRWAVSFWWDEFLGSVERIKLTIKAAIKTMEETKAWVENHFSTTLAMMDVYFTVQRSHSISLEDDKRLPTFKDWISKLTEDGCRRFKSSHITRLQAAGLVMPMPI